MRLTRSTLTPALALAAALTLTACAGDDTTTSAPQAPAETSAPQAPAETSASPSADAESADFNDVDVRFTQGMLPHHMQAARNAELEIAMGSDPEVIAIAQQILDTQLMEIATMQGFLEEFGAEPMMAPADQQEVWDRNTEALRNAPTPEARDIVFLTNMVPHHSAAVPMSQLEITMGAYQPAIELAQDIKTTQREEIMKMNMIIRMKAGVTS